MDEVARTPVRLLLRSKSARRIHRAQRVGNHRPAQRGRAPPPVRRQRKNHPRRSVTLHQAPCHHRQPPPVPVSPAPRRTSYRGADRSIRPGFLTSSAEHPPSITPCGRNASRHPPADTEIVPLQQEQCEHLAPPVNRLAAVPPASPTMRRECNWHSPALWATVNVSAWCPSEWPGQHPRRRS